jgi:hypothetical protein
MTEKGLLLGCKGDLKIHQSIDVIYLIMRVKDKNHRNLSTDAGKAFDKIEQLLMRKNS